MEKKSLYINLGIFGVCLIIIIASFFFFGKGSSSEKFIDSKIYEIETKSVSATMKDKPLVEPIHLSGETSSNQYDCKGGRSCINMSNYEDSKEYILLLPFALDNYKETMNYRVEVECVVDKEYCIADDITKLKMEKKDILFIDEGTPK